MNCRSSFRSVLALLSLTLAAGCGPADDAPGGSDGGFDGDGGMISGTLEITPGDITLNVVDGGPAQQAFSVQHRALDNTVRDVTVDAFFTLDNVRLGTFTNELFSASGLAGGVGRVTASYRGLQAIAQLTVNVRDRRVGQGVPLNAPDLFDNATDDATLASTIVYPADTTMVPPNLGDFEVHWMGAGGADLFEIAITATHIDLRIYTVGTPNAGNWAAYLPSEWSIAGLSERGGQLAVTVRAMLSTDTTRVGSAAPISVKLTEQDVQGGVYYWASIADNNAPEGIYRHDMSRPGEAAEQFYTRAQAPNGRCVACHVISRDGTRMAITYDGGDGAASIVDVGTRTEMLAVDGTFKWNFATYEPSGARIVTVHQGAMVLRDANTGAVLSPVTTNGWASHPDFSPTGDKLVYVGVGTPGQDWHFTGGSLMVVSFDAVNGTFGTPTALVPQGAENNFYPSWSPDGQWVMFNRSTEDAYDDTSAEIWIVKADGSVGPTKLSTPNTGPGLTNSWARWAPFAETLGGQEPYFWFTFSSKRAFGVRLGNGARPQVWMAPFFPTRLEASNEPSAPAFRLPFQDITSNNHIAQWTEQVIPVD
ncbi:MAG TPA: hypothetical protein VML75_29275 [Kofleriaceae bacterium]|nr:hypothetical protein [Kofleriaceae bacterium]